MISLPNKQTKKKERGKRSSPALHDALGFVKSTFDQEQTAYYI